MSNLKANGLQQQIALSGYTQEFEAVTGQLFFLERKNCLAFFPHLQLSI